MELFGTIYEETTITKLKKKYFVEQLRASTKPIVNIEMLKKIDNKLTLFGNEIKKGDFLLLGLIISDIVNDRLIYNFFYCTRNELKLLGNGSYFASGPEAGIPKIIHKKTVQKFKEKEKKHER